MGFEKCHPAVNFLYFATVIAAMILFQHPIFLAISLACAFAYSVRRNRGKAVIFNLLLIPLAVAFALYYSSYHHFGVTVLRKNFISNNMTLESLVYGLVLGGVIIGVMMWLSCVYSVFTTDKVVYLFGKVSPRLSLLLAITLRTVPRIQAQARKINTAQSGIGRGIGQGNLLCRMRNGLKIVAILISWSIDSLIAASESMRSRGSSLRGRTAFSIYRFDNRDRAYVITLFACLTVILMAVMLQQIDIIYNPRILMTPITPMSYLFYAGYGLFCLMPIGLELWTEFQFNKARKAI